VAVSEGLSIDLLISGAGLASGGGREKIREVRSKFAVGENLLTVIAHVACTSVKTLMSLPSLPSKERSQILISRDQPYAAKTGFFPMWYSACLCLLGAQLLHLDISARIFRVRILQRDLGYRHGKFLYLAGSDSIECLPVDCDSLGAQ